MALLIANPAWPLVGTRFESLSSVQPTSVVLEVTGRLVARATKRSFVEEAISRPH
jgi:hypothetical protein